MFILLVGNNVSDLKQIKKYIMKYLPNSVFMPFTDSSKAISFIKKEKAHIDLCFTEINMSGVTGFGVSEELHKRDKYAKVVFVSKSPDYAMDAWRYNVNDYLLLPVTDEGIRHALESCSYIIDRQLGKDIKVVKNADTHLINIPRFTDAV